MYYLKCLMYEKKLYFDLKIEFRALSSSIGHVVHSVLIRTNQIIRTVERQEHLEVCLRQTNTA